MTSPNPEALLNARGLDVGRTEWPEIVQDDVDAFAKATLAQVVGPGLRLAAAEES